MENDKLVRIITIVFFIIFGILQLINLTTVLDIHLDLNSLSEFKLPIVIGIIGIIIILWVIITYNKFIKLNMKVNQARGGIDVYLKKRFDLIPNLVETVKEYKKYEENVLEEITNLRADYESRNDQDIKESESLNNRFSRILVVLENYPELKASEQFLNLQKSLSKVESELQAARRIYNSEVTEYNVVRFKFPSNIIGNIFAFEEKKLFEIEEYEKEATNINL